MLYSLLCYAIPNPSVVADIETVDVGSVTQVPFTTSFLITNNGNRIVSIGDPVTSCTCTSVDLAVKEISPGESFNLVAHIKPANGKLISHVKLPFRYSDTEGQLSLAVIGNIVPHIGLKQSSVNLPLEGKEHRFAVKVHISESEVPKKEV